MLVATAAGSAGAQADKDAQLWRQLAKGGNVVFIRHAQTVSGVGDPPGFKLDDCGTQRNLSEQGRVDARRIGTALRDRAIPVDAVHSSRWCRCLDTARMAFGTVRPDPMLDSMFGMDDGANAAKVRAVAAAAAAWSRSASGNLIFVTHAVNIQEHTGISPASGEMVVTRPSGQGGFTVLGRLTATGG